VRTFWTLWTIAALVAAIILFFFIWGLADGSVSSFNAGIWTIALAVVAVVVVGSLWLKSAGHPALGAVRCLVLALPGLLYAFFLAIVILSGARWN
jgi:hypothetical protein